MEGGQARTRRYKKGEALAFFWNLTIAERLTHRRRRRSNREGREVIRSRDPACLGNLHDEQQQEPIRSAKLDLLTLADFDELQERKLLRPLSRPQEETA